MGKSSFPIENQRKSPKRIANAKKTTSDAQNLISTTQKHLQHHNHHFHNVTGTKFLQQDARTACKRNSERVNSHPNAKSYPNSSQASGVPSSCSAHHPAAPLPPPLAGRCDRRVSTRPSCYGRGGFFSVSGVMWCCGGRAAGRKGKVPGLGYDFASFSTRSRMFYAERGVRNRAGRPAQT